MAKTKKEKKKKIKVKEKNKNNNNRINIKVNIDQSKRTTGGNAKKSNIKQLPSYSAAPSAGGNYVRQFTQDPYISQSQYEHMNNLLQYNKNLPQWLGNENRNKNYQQLGYFQDKNINDNQLSTNDGYETQDDESQILENIIDYSMNDDPTTNGDPQNSLNTMFQNQPDQKLSAEEQKEEQKEEVQKEVKQIEFKQSGLMQAYHDPTKTYYRDIKLVRDIPPGKVFNKKTGKFVLTTNTLYTSAIVNSGKMNTIFKPQDFLENPIDITQAIYNVFYGPDKDLNTRNTGWINFKKK